GRPTGVRSEVQGERANEGPRLARREELDELADLMVACFGGALGPRRRRRRPRWIQRSGAWVIAREGRLVSHIRLVYNVLSIYGCRVKLASIGGVCTHPDYRNQGLASLLLEHCAVAARQAGASLLLISGGRGLYRRAMAVDAVPTFVGKVGRGSIEIRNGAPRARPGRPEDWSVCARLYQAEPVRFVRVAEVFARALRGHGHHVPWVIEGEGDVVAYVVLSRDWGHPPESRERWVSEYAGVRGALAEGLPSLLEAADVDEIEFRAPQWDRELTHVLHGADLRLAAGTLWEHTTRLLDLPLLMRRLRPYLAARLTRKEMRTLAFAQTEKECVFTRGDEALTLDVGKATALVLGGPEAPAVHTELGESLNVLFPIPFPLPGMNYV
ncbi:MAG: GNAT family N-acetyltransferase, partial [Thermoleophilia bacterium]|nr:GNAT family N-acetyltransferase [Thermoleophilia bacterium]